VPASSRNNASFVGAALLMCAALFGCNAATGTLPSPNTGLPVSAATGSLRSALGASAWTPQNFASLPADGVSHTFTFPLRPQDFGDPTNAGSNQPYAHPITLTLTETGDTGHSTLLLNGVAVGSKATITNSGQSVALRYDGRGAVSYTTLTTMTAASFPAYVFRVSPLYVEPLDIYWIPSDNLLVPAVIPVSGVNVYLDVVEVGAPSSVQYTATPTSGCARIATVVMTNSTNGAYATLTGGQVPAQIGPCSVTISDGSSAVTTAVENRIAGPYRFGGVTLTTYWPQDVSTLNAVGVDIGSYVRGPDGAVWFWEDAGNPAKIGRVSTNGTITEFPAPLGHQGFSIANGPDGNLWVTNAGGRSIDRVTTAGAFTTFPLPQGSGFPLGITGGPDGNVWFTTALGAYLYRITPSGTITPFALPNGVSAGSITSGPDGNLWFSAVSAVGRCTPTGTITMFAVASLSYPDGITTGPDGNIWFAESSGNAIGRVTPSGTVTEFPLPTPNSSPQSIAVGPDGNLWFSIETGAQIGRITMSGAITEFSSQYLTGNANIVLGYDGNLWLGYRDSIQKAQL
jgi:virginiamycin B lyase